MSETIPFHNFTDAVPKLREVLSHGLIAGVGDPEPGALCVEAAVCLVLGLPHGDNPVSCVGRPDNRFAIRLNDASWSSNKARAEGMAEFAIAHLGSATMTDEQRGRWTAHIVEQTIRRIVPLALRAVAKRNPKHATALEGAALRCEQEGTKAAAEQARSVVRAADAYAAADAAYAAADAAAHDAAHDAAAYAAYAAADADAAADAAYAAADAAHDAAGARDHVLRTMASIAVEAYALVRA